METIGKKLTNLAQRNFKHCAISERTPATIQSLLNTRVHGSENMIVFPEVDGVEVNKIDALHDEVTMLWSDLQVKGVMTWREGKGTDNKHTFCLESYE